MTKPRCVRLRARRRARSPGAASRQTDGQTRTGRQTDRQPPRCPGAGGRAGGPHLPPQAPAAGRGQPADAARASGLRRPAEAAASHNGHRCTAPRRAPNGRAPTAAPQPLSAGEGQGRPRPRPRALITCSPQPGEHLLPHALPAGRGGTTAAPNGESGRSSGSAPPPLPSLRPPPATTRLRIAGAAAESGSRCLCYASPGRSALLGEPGLQLLRLSSADCRLQGFALARPSLKCGSSHQPLPAALSGGRRRRHLPLSRRLPLFSLPSALRGDRRSCPPRSARVPGEPAAPLCDPRAGRGRGEAGLGRRATLPLGSP